MTRPISEDLRRRILEVREQSGKTYEELAEQFRVGRATVNRVLRLKRETGDVQPWTRAAGADVLYLPPYSPDLNPIELCWSKVKALLRKLAARTVSTLKVAIQEATEAVTQRDAEGWFIHCGYSVPCD